MVTTTKIQTFLSLSKLAPYDGKYKDEYRKLGQCILRQLAKDLELKRGEFDIRWNPGGVAVPGDHVLHTDRVYVAFHDNIGSGWFYWRTCKGLWDYMGGQNHIVYWEEIMNGGWVDFVKTLKEVQYPMG